MGKKDKKLMDELSVKFVSGAQKKNISKHKAEQIYALIEKFAQYGFNKSHATGLQKNQLLNEEELAKYQDEYGEESFTAGIGAEAVLEMLKNLDLELERKNLVNFIKETKSKVNEERAIKRLKLVESFIETGQKPEWMIMTVVMYKLRYICS